MSYIPRKERKPKPWGRKQDQRLYQSRSWRRYTDEYLEGNPYCVECKKQGKRTRATTVDHIIPVRFKPNLFWDENNHQGMCKTHHNRKTAIESHCKTYQEWQTKFNSR